MSESVSENANSRLDDMKTVILELDGEMENMYPINLVESRSQMKRAAFKANKKRFERLKNPLMQEVVSNYMDRHPEVDDIRLGAFEVFVSNELDDQNSEVRGYMDTVYNALFDSVHSVDFEARDQTVLDHIETLSLVCDEKFMAELDNPEAETFSVRDMIATQAAAVLEAREAMSQETRAAEKDAFARSAAEDAFAPYTPKRSAYLAAPERGNQNVPMGGKKRRIREQNRDKGAA